MSVVQRAYGGFLDDWRSMAAAVNGECIEGRGTLLVYTGLPAAMFNKVFVLEKPPDGWLDDIQMYLGKQSVPFSIEVRSDLDDDALVAAGFEKLGDMPFMVWDQPSDEWPAPEGIVIEELPLDAALDGFNGVVADGFNMPRDLVDRIGALLGRAEGVHLFQARDGERVVGTSVGSGDELAGVYTVATIPSYRKRGIGAALTAAAARGSELAYLQASSMGQPVYEAMGFREMERAFLYALPGITS